MIEIIKLSKLYGSFLALDDITLKIPQGIIFAFLGVNGAGKTTTIRIMTGVIRPSSGTVRIGGFDVLTEAERAKGIMGVIPDRPYIYTKLTGREFLAFIAELYNVDKALAAPRIEELLQQHGLSNWKDELVEGYSHGMRQRLLLCASQVHNPPILVVDEPMVGLDPRGSKLIKETFRERAKQGQTIFMSTHSLGVAEDLADQLAIIHHGRIVASGTLEDLYKKAHAGVRDLEEVFLQITEETEGDGVPQL